MPSTVSLIAPAKINLSLHLHGKRNDGYHEIETLMAPLRLADEITLACVFNSTPKAITFSCSDSTLPTNIDNLCVKAAHFFLETVDTQAAIEMMLLKNIPHGAGLGGGSSDAAATLQGMNLLFGKPLTFEKLHQLATRLGSDVPFFLDPQPRWCHGRGEILGKAASLPDWKLLLIKPPFGISSAEAYKRSDHIPKNSTSPATFAKEPHDTNLFFEGASLFNALELPVFGKYLQLPILKSWLQAQPEIITSWMTGSGSTLVAALPRNYSAKKITVLQKRILTVFGSSFWIQETSFL